MLNFVYDTIKHRIHQEAEEMLKEKKTMKIQSVVKFRMKKLKTKDEQEEDKQNKGDTDSFKYDDKMENTKADSVTSNNIIQVLENNKNN